MRSKAIIRNPLLGLPAFRRMLAELVPEQKRVLATLLRELTAEASLRAEKCWKGSKGPMAAYWKAVSVYAKAHSQGDRSELSE